MTTSTKKDAQTANAKAAEREKDVQSAAHKEMAAIGRDYAKSISVVEASAIQGATLQQKVADSLIALGFLPVLSDKGVPSLPETLKGWADRCIADGLYAAKRWTKAEHAMVIGGADQAKAKGIGAQRSKLTTCLPQYRKRLAEKMVALVPEVKQDAEERQAKAKKEREAAQNDSAGVSESGQSEAVATSVKGIDPSKDVESYKAALNLLIVATGNLGLDKLHGKGIIDAYQEILKTL